MRGIVYFIFYVSFCLSWNGIWDFGVDDDEKEEYFI